jgi:hypothetical protein
MCGLTDVTFILATCLDVDIGTIDNYMRQGWIPYYKVGKLVYFYWPEVMEWIVVKRT